MSQADACRHHPSEPAAALCQKYGHGLCAACLEHDPACPDPDIYCKFRPQCLIHFNYKEQRRAGRGQEGSPMSHHDFADFITRLPQADIPMAGVTAYLLAAPQGQTVFFRLPAGASVPPHSHGAQWGIVVQGNIELTIGGVTHNLVKGDDYYIGEGVVHSAVVKTDSLVIDVFADPGRYRAKA